MDATVFLLFAEGQIEWGDFPEFDSLYCKYTIVHGPDWVVTAGLEEGATQIASKFDDHVVWNFPVEATFKSTNPFGWPQLVLSVYGLDGMGRDVPRGYGCVRFPITPGCHELYADMFVPQSSSAVQQFVSWLFGERPEYVDATIVARDAGRDVTRVRSQGRVKVTLNVMLKDFAALGYDSGGGAARAPSSMPTAPPSAATSSGPAGGGGGASMAAVASLASRSLRPKAAESLSATGTSFPLAVAPPTALPPLRTERRTQLPELGSLREREGPADARPQPLLPSSFSSSYAQPASSAPPMDPALPAPGLAPAAPYAPPAPPAPYAAASSSAPPAAPGPAPPGTVDAFFAAASTAGAGRKKSSLALAPIPSAGAPLPVASGRPGNTGQARHPSEAALESEEDPRRRPGEKHVLMEHHEIARAAEAEVPSAAARNRDGAGGPHGEAAEDQGAEDEGEVEEEVVEAEEEEEEQ